MKTYTDPRFLYKSECGIVSDSFPRGFEAWIMSVCIVYASMLGVA